MFLECLSGHSLFKEVGRLEVSFDLIQYMRINRLSINDLYSINSTPYEELNKELIAIKKHRPDKLQSSTFATMLVDCYGAYRKKDYESYYLLARALCFKRLGNISEILEEFKEIFIFNKLGIMQPLEVKFERTDKYLNNSYNKICDSNNNLIEITDFGIYMQEQCKTILLENHRYILDDSLFVVEQGNLIGEQYQLAYDYTCGIMATRPIIPRNNLRYYKLDELVDLGENMYYNFFRIEDIVKTLNSIPKDIFVDEVTELIKNKNLNTFYFKHNPPNPTKPINYNISKQPINIVNILKNFVVQLSNTNTSVAEFIDNKELTNSIILQALNIYMQ